VTITDTHPRAVTPADGPLAATNSVAGAVLRSARRSARASQAKVAVGCGVTQHAVQAWEAGTSPLAEVCVLQVESLIAALRDLGACPRLTGDLITATWCDVVIAAATDSEDCECLVADPSATNCQFIELMAWFTEGRVPQRYRPYADKHPLTGDRAVIQKVRQVLRDIQR